MPLYWLVYRHNNQISVIIEPGAHRNAAQTVMAEKKGAATDAITSSSTAMSIHLLHLVSHQSNLRHRPQGVIAMRAVRSAMLAAAVSREHQLWRNGRRT